MFGWLNRSRQNKVIIARWRDAIMAKARSPEPFLNGWVEDTLEGRFQMVALVATPVMRRLRASGASGQALSKQVSEALFSSFDHALREQGVGDSSMPRRIRKMGEEFYGLARALDLAMADAASDTDPVAVIQRNVQPDADKASQLAGLVKQLDADLGQLTEDAILRGPASL